MIEKDVQYVNNRSLLLDLKISLKTIRLIVLQDNA
jgi:lipopolysaccharide/colanic/teichoic acid biosynthesis glycosyltransferase